MGRGADPVLSYQPDDGFTVKDWGWADTEHLLVVVAEMKNPRSGTCCASRSTVVSRMTLGRPVDGPNRTGTAFLLSD